MIVGPGTQLITGHQRLIESLHLPDPDDRHVLAAALAAQAGAIVTYNVKDFPQATMAPLGIEVEHPDEFVVHLIDLSQAAVCAAVRDQRLALKKPPKSVRELLDVFLSLELAGTVAALEQMQELL